MIINKEKLIESKKDIESKAKFWNQNNLFLYFGLASAIFLTNAIELFKIIAKDYKFNFKELFSSVINFGDWYLIGILLFSIFGLVTAMLSAKVIGENKEHFNNLVNGINKLMKP
ncbi:MAG: hypothetical protein AABW47_04145 [Nanoarchaeota archaeon]